MERNSEDMDSICNPINDFKWDHDSDYVVEERETISQWCVNNHESLKSMLMGIFRKIDGKVCLTTDIWTTSMLRTYLTLTCHYADDEWHLKSVVLNFHHFPSPHTASETAMLLYSMLEDWGLEKKVFSLTVDDTSNMNVMTAMLQEKLQTHCPLLGNGKHFHIRCGARTFNFIVNEALKVVDGVVGVIRDIVKYINSSEVTYNRFMACVMCVNGDQNPSNLNLWLDVPTRWNSTYIMLIKAEVLKDALDRFAEIEDHYPYYISPESWKSVKEICLLLKPFYEITNLFSGSDYPTSNYYFEKLCEIEFQLRKLSDNTNTGIRTMALSMLMKFDKYWSNYLVILSIAALLDPRVKTKSLSSYLSRAYHSNALRWDKFNEVKETLVNLFNEYKGISFPSTPVHSVATECDTHMLLHDDTDIFKSFKFGSSSTNKTEIDTYFDSPVLKVVYGCELDVIVWWRKQALEFPVLSRLARDLLIIPITTVAFGSTFSMGDRVFNKWKDSLLVTDIEALITSHHWISSYDGDDDNVLRTEVAENDEEED